MDALERLQAFFRELFLLDLADLDFGIYRLYHLKQEEIEKFIAEQLPREVDEAFAEVSREDKEVVEQDLEKLARQVKENFGDTALSESGEIIAPFDQTPLGRKYTEARRKLAAIKISEGHKIEVFNHLVNFFSRYYEDGDFIPKRRYGAREAYAVPYNGEEVFFHWANRDQHYVKTTEQFKDYAFKVDGLTGSYRVRFIITEASVPRDNTKGKHRYFFPRPDLAEYNPETHEFVLPFEYRLPTPEEAEQYGSNAKAQQAILEEAYQPILDAIPEMGLQMLFANQDRDQSVLFRRMRHFCRRNTSDYFIHKDLRGFLQRELEFYIKDQIIHVMDIEGDLDAKRRIIRVFRRLAGQVIDFLATVEDVQKTLFEKKKFVLETDYLIPIQHVPRAFWPEILANQGQLDEWERWGMLNPVADLMNQTGEVNEAFLEKHPTLSVHTRHFSTKFTRRLLEALPFEDLDEATDGVLVHSENYQALGLLQAKYQNAIDYAYLDPPFNTSEKSFLYKNEYRHSSWLTMLLQTTPVLFGLLKESGLVSIAIDDFELFNLGASLNEIWGEERKLGVLSVEIKPSGRTNDTFFATSHEFSIWYGKTEKEVEISFFELPEDMKADYKEQDEQGAYKWRDFLRTGGYSTPEERPNSYYPIYFRESDGYIGIKPVENAIEIWPIDTEGRRRVWRKTPSSLMEHIENNEIKVEKGSRGMWKIRIKDRIKTGIRPKSVWTGARYDASSHGTKLLQKILGRNAYFSYPKSIYLVYDSIWIAAKTKQKATILDYFAGSGTTGHAVINLNREDGGQRKFILVEMGEYFDTVLVPRIAKVMFTPEWRDGKPKRLATQEEAQRTPRVVKIIRLESYDDALHNIAAPTALERAAALEQPVINLDGEDAFRLKYWITLPLEQSETMLRTLNLRRPFEYSLEILTDDGPQRKPVDLVETFNYLYGLRVRRYETWRNPEDGSREYRVVKARDREGRRHILVIWRDMDGMDTEKDRAFLERKMREMEDAGETWDEILINGDTPTPGIASLDPLFKERMMTGETA